ncbi:caffeic acid 3-O-methyltransferase-like [Solanum stenotomum]|uniref:caffeic acid 3-O-methyltransferase-like n=1 Tax=Solanum stenotomum TaxID=172797 RepID=UPI0020D16DDE|nr:caffeic acid 3-O-methyltransferase-like [Solanum stenotomum]
MANMSQLPISIGSDKEGNLTYAMQLLSSSVLPFVLHSTIELNVFEILAKANDTQLSSSQIVSKMACNNPIDAANMLDRMLYLLATYSLLTCSINNNNVRLYGLSPVGKMFVSDNEDGASLRPLLDLLQQKVVINTWFGLKDAILEGGVPFERMHGVNTFEYLKTDHMYNDVFNKAMFNHTTLMMKNILDKYKGFENIKTLVDVGGGLGSNLKMITTKYPTIKGTNFDVPHVVQHAFTYNGVEHVAGDMFESVPEGDVIFMKWILHDWSDSQCVKLLKNCYKATPAENGKVIVVESILPVKPNHSSVISVSQFDMIMLANSPGGKERSEHEFRALAIEAGFKEINLICCVCNFWVMEFYK